MGTSKRYGGPQNGLLPTWIDDVSPGASAPQTTGPGTQIPQIGVPEPTAQASSAAGLSQARSNLSRFARTRDGAALRRAVSQYVRQGTGGASGAARRMGAARAAGSQLLRFIGDVQRNGAAAALQRVNLGNLAGQPATTVFVALAEVICPPGGRVDEAISRQAMLDTIADLAEQGVDSFDSLSRDQLVEFFLGYVIHTIEGRVLADLGKNALDRTISADEAILVQQDLHDFVEGSVRGHLGTLLDGAEAMAEADLLERVERIYEASYTLISAIAGDLE